MKSATAQFRFVSKIFKSNSKLCNIPMKTFLVILSFCVQFLATRIFYRLGVVYNVKLKTKHFCYSVGREGIKDGEQKREDINFLTDSHMTYAT